MSEADQFRHSSSTLSLDVAALPIRCGCCRRRNAVLVASFAFSLIGNGSVHFLVIVLKPLSTELGWPRSVPSMSYALQYVGGGVGGILMGRVLDRHGMTMPALSGAVSLSIGAMATYYVNEPWQLHAIAIVVGVMGRSTIFTPLTTNIMRWFEDSKSAAVGIVGSGGMIGGAMWPLVFEHLVERLGWRTTSLWYSALVLVVMLPLAFVLRLSPPALITSKALEQPAATDEPHTFMASEAESSTSRPEVPTSCPAASEVPPSPALRATVQSPVSACSMTTLLAVASVSCCTCMALPLAHLTSHVSDLGYKPARGAEVLSVSLTCASVSAIVGVGYLGRHFGGLGALLIFSSAMSFFLLCLAAAEGLTSLYVCSALYGLGYGGVLLCYPVIVREYLPANEAGVRIGTIMLIASFGMAIGSWLGGASYDALGSYRMGFVIGATADLVNLVIVVHLLLRVRLRPRATWIPTTVARAFANSTRRTRVWKSHVDEPQRAM